MHPTSRLSPDNTRAIVFEQQQSVSNDNDAMDIGIIQTLQPFDKSVKRLAVEAGTLRFGYFPVRKRHDLTQRWRAHRENRGRATILKLESEQRNPRRLCELVACGAAFRMTGISPLTSLVMKVRVRFAAGAFRPPAVVATVTPDHHRQDAPTDGLITRRLVRFLIRATRFDLDATSGAL
jgi:hypothetical protein